jgi:hypothetical protein
MGWFVISELRSSRTGKGSVNVAEGGELIVLECERLEAEVFSGTSRSVRFKRKFAD